MSPFVSFVDSVLSPFLDFLAFAGVVALIIVAWVIIYRYDRRKAQEYGAAGPGQRVTWWWPEIKSRATAEYVCKRMAYWMAFGIVVATALAVAFGPPPAERLLTAIFLALSVLVVLLIPVFLYRQSKVAAVLALLLFLLNLVLALFTKSGSLLGLAFGVVQGVNGIRATYFKEPPATLNLAS